MSLRERNEYTVPAAASPRFGGVWPDRLLKYRPPLWWQEVALVVLGYWLYGMARNAVPEQESIAMRHGVWLHNLQDDLAINWELSLNKWVAANEPVAQFMDYYYATVHFFLTAGVLIWLFRCRHHIYRGVRTVLFATSIVGLVGFWLYPLAPPRLLPEFGYIDTIIVFRTWGSWADPNIAEHSNQFAAMPSLHFAWALWVGIALYKCARQDWVRVLGILHPVITLLVIMGTANHFVLDAAGGAVALFIGFGVQRAMSGRSAYSPAHDSPFLGLRALKQRELQSALP